MKFISAAIFVVVWKISIASRALFLFPVHSKSHLVVVQGLSTFLAQKGHNVTVVSPFPLSKPMENYRDIELPLTGEALEIASNVMKDPNQSIIKELFKLFEVVANMSEKMLEMPEFQKIMNEEKFDLVVIGMFMNDYILGIGDHFKCPTMMLSVGGAMTQTNLLVGNPLGVSAVPHMIATAVNGMTFLDRLKNFALYGLDLAIQVYWRHLNRKIYE